MNIVTGSSPLGGLIAMLVALFGLLGPPAPARSRQARANTSTSTARVGTARGRAAAKRGPQSAFAVGIRTLRFVDHSRTVQFPSHKPSPRTLVTVIRYPALGPVSSVDRPGAPPARAGGPFPLVIFGHGFAVTPGPYAQLLQAWARAGYVVAAPIFPLGNGNAPGGPNESDIVNQPRDMSFVISQMLALSAGHRGLFAGLIAAHEIAVSGQSDGGETALAAAYDQHYLDRRIRAAVILSGAQLPGAGFAFPSPSPPLLATQGTADTINRPVNTYAFFDAAPRPKFLLYLQGAPHLPPYTTEEPQLGIVQSVTIAFLDRYLKGSSRALARMNASGNVPGIASLQADP